MIKDIYSYEKLKFNVAMQQFRRVESIYTL